LAIYSSEVWLFYYPVSYLTAFLGIATRKVPQEVAEEYLPGGEELSEALRNIFFERAEDVVIQEQERTEEKEQVMAAAEFRRANQLIRDQSSALGTFTSDSDAWNDWQKNFRRLSRIRQRFEVSSLPSDVWRPS
jgi:hypothetical protein